MEQLSTSLFSRAQPLDDARYMNGHLLFRRRSTQQAAILDWLQTEISAHWKLIAGERLRLLSVGSGAGILDAPLVQSLQEISPVDFIGVDPNEAENSECREALGRVLSGTSTATIHSGAIESFEASFAVDVAIVVHALYYTSDLEFTMSRILHHVRPGGLIYILNAPGIEKAPLSQYFCGIGQEASGHKPALTPDVLTALQRHRVPHYISTLPCTVDLTGIEDPGNEDGNLLIDFICHADLQDADCSLRQGVREQLLQENLRNALPPLLPHPVDAITGVRLAAEG